MWPSECDNAHPRGRQMETIPIAALFDEVTAQCPQVHYRKLLIRADVIIGLDLESQREFTVFGTPALEETVRLDAPRRCAPCASGSSGEVQTWTS